MASKQAGDQGIAARISVNTLFNQGGIDGIPWLFLGHLFYAMLFDYQTGCLSLPPTNTIKRDQQSVVFIMTEQLILHAIYLPII